MDFSFVLINSSMTTVVILSIYLPNSFANMEIEMNCVRNCEVYHLGSMINLAMEF